MPAAGLRAQARPCRAAGGPGPRSPAGRAPRTAPRSVRAARGRAGRPRPKMAIAPPNHRAAATPVSSPASICSSSARSMSARPGRVTEHRRGPAPVVQDRGLTGEVPGGTGAGEGLVEQRDCRGPVPLVGRKPRRTVERVHPLGVVVRDPFEQFGQAPPALGEVSADGPEGGEPVRQTKGRARLHRGVPVQRSTEVVVLAFEQVEAHPARARRRAGQVLGQRPERRRVRRAHPVAGQAAPPAARRRTPGRSPASRTSRRPPTPAPPAGAGRGRPAPPGRPAPERAARPPRRRRSRGRPGRCHPGRPSTPRAAPPPPRSTAHGSRRSWRAAPAADPGRPGDRRPADPGSPPAAPRIAAGGSSFTRAAASSIASGSPSSRSHDPRDGGRVLAGDGEARHRRGCPRREQPHRLASADRRRRNGGAPRRDAQRGHRELLLPRQVQRRAAGDENPRPRGGGEQVGDEPRVRRAPAPCCPGSTGRPAPPGSRRGVPAAVCPVRPATRCRGRSTPAPAPGPAPLPMTRNAPRRGKSSGDLPASSIASRVLPQPPGPVNVSSRVPSSRLSRLGQFALPAHETRRRSWQHARSSHHRAEPHQCECAQRPRLGRLVRVMHSCFGTKW